MVTEDLVIELSRECESPILEFKREWYWDNNTEKDKMQLKWGEFLKDLIALFNGYCGYVRKDRFLIIGFDEKEKKFYDVDIENINALKDLQNLKKVITSKTEALLRVNKLDFNISFCKVDNNNILVFHIKPSKYLFELKNQLTTKTRTFDDGVILIRRGQASDEVRMANHDEILLLKKELEVFTNEKVDDLLDNEAISEVKKKDRSIQSTIQLFIDKNQNYNLDEDGIIFYKNRELNILFEWYQLNDILNKKTIFLYVSENSSQSATYRHLREKKIITDANQQDIILLTERPESISPEKRKENLRQTFKCHNIWFIDEFGYHQLYKDCFSEYIPFNLPLFIESHVEEGGLSAHNILSEWLKVPSNPLFIVKGHGGIGKTTLAKQFLDHVHSINPSTGILFIDSNDIINELANISESSGKVSNIFDFYMAQYLHYDSDETIFTKELLRLSLDNGNLVIVLDGLDEVIAKLGDKFDVAKFVDSIYDSKTSTLEKTKVLITCREHFWDGAKSSSFKTPEITLKPFNKELAKNFFNLAFVDNASKVIKAMSIADKIAVKPKSEEVSVDIYIPYVLDLIKYLVEQDENYSLNSVFKCSYLEPSLQDDYIVGSVCNREIKKLGAMDVDAQVRLLMHISTATDSSISIYNLKDIIREETGIVASDILIEKIQDHPLLAYHSNKLTFRYDFFNDFFKTIYLANFFKEKELSNLDEKIVSLTCGYIKYNNTFSQNLLSRIIFDDEMKLFIMECIEKEKEENNDKVKPFVSSLFMVALTSLASSENMQNNLESRTALFKDFFELSGGVNSAYIMNLFGYERIKPTFDFRGVVITDSYFENYEFFWDCNIDENTRFNRCDFHNLMPRQGLNPVFYKNTFSSDCNTVGIRDLLVSSIDNINEKETAIKEGLVAFFKIFHERGNFYPKKQAHVKSKINVSKFLPILLKNKVVDNYIDKKKPNFEQYRINAKYNGLVNYLEQGGDSTLLDELVQLFR